MALHHDLLTARADTPGPRRPVIRVDRCTDRRSSLPYLARLENALEAAFLLAFAETGGRA